MTEHKKTNPFYLSPEWRELRKWVLQRDNYLCVPCYRKQKISAAIIVHHLKPIETHPELALDPENCVSQCGTCHNKVHPERAKTKAVEQREYKARVIKG